MRPSVRVHTTDIREVPNITGAAGNYASAGMLYLNGETDGAFYPGKETPRYSADGDGAGRFLAFQASRSNGLYGDSSTIQPKSLTALYIIRI